MSLYRHYYDFNNGKQYINKLNVSHIIESEKFTAVRQLTDHVV